MILSLSALSQTLHVYVCSLKKKRKRVHSVTHIYVRTTNVQSVGTKRERHNRTVQRTTLDCEPGTEVDDGKRVNAACRRGEHQWAATNTIRRGNDTDTRIRGHEYTQRSGTRVSFLFTVRPPSTRFSVRRVKGVDRQGRFVVSLYRRNQ